MVSFLERLGLNKAPAVELDGLIARLAALNELFSDLFAPAFCMRENLGLMVLPFDFCLLLMVGDEKLEFKLLFRVVLPPL